MYPFKIPELPPSVNHIYSYGSHGVYKNKTVAQFEKVASLYVPRQRTPISEPCVLHARFEMLKPSTLKKRDVDNMLKVLQDLLVAKNFIENDALVYDLDIKKRAGDADCVTGFFSIADLSD
jgi:Holliday junction resolvase RusA-like endonuclease